MNGFTVYKEYYDLITLLSEREQEKLSWAIWKYMFDGIEPNLNENQMKIFNNLKRPLDASKNQSKRRTKIKPNKNQIETKKEPNNNPNETHQDVNVVVSNYDNNYVVNVNNNLFEFIEKEFGRTFSPSELELISTWEDNELTRHAIKETVLARSNSLKYTQSILNSYKAKGFKNLSDIEADEKEFELKKKGRNNGFKTQLEKNRETIEEFRNDKG